MNDRGEKSICKQNIFFGAGHSYNEKKIIFWGGDSVKKTKRARTSTLKRCLSTTKDQAQTYSRRQ